MCPDMRGALSTILLSVAALIEPFMTIVLLFLTGRMHVVSAILLHGMAMVPKVGLVVASTFM